MVEPLHLSSFSLVTANDDFPAPTSVRVSGGRSGRASRSLPGQIRLIERSVSEGRW